MQMTSSHPILRYQDAHGRGPFRPGLPAFWADKEGESPPALAEDFGPVLSGVIEKAYIRGLHLGSAVRGLKGIKRWFTDGERRRLEAMGFRIFDASCCEILLETKWQLLIGSNEPFKTLPMLEMRNEH
jgi:hypothetical protein